MAFPTASPAEADPGVSIPALKNELLVIQQQLREAQVAVLILLEGMEASGRGAVANQLETWLDPRGVETHSFPPQPEGQDAQYPDHSRFWKALPARGRIGVFLGSWYGKPLHERCLQRLNSLAFDHHLERILWLEKMLSDDGMILVKFWLHLDRRTQARRLKQLKETGRPLPKILPKYERLMEVARQVLERTDASENRWHVIPCDDETTRDMMVLRTLVRVLQRRCTLLHSRVTPATSSAVVRPYVTAPELSLDQVDLSKRLESRAYAEALKECQQRLRTLTWDAAARGISTVLVFEGWDASGKGGAIRRLVGGIDPRLFRVHATCAPSQEEKRFHYLWRFWRHVPSRGQVAIFDRSWYGRVLVERVEGFATETEWRRAYAEITDFEDQLVEAGVQLIKFWMHISPEEQLKRFEARATDPRKQHKITAEDWRNREKWGLYQEAVNEMLARTHRKSAPWVLVAGNDKNYARIEVLKRVIQTLEDAIRSARKANSSPGQAK